MKGLHFFILLFWTFSSLSQAEEGFILSDEQAAIAPLLERTQESDISLCSGSFISRHGHYLTALHCIYENLASRNLLEIKSERDVEFYQPKEGAVGIRFQELFIQMGGEEISAPELVFVGAGNFYPFPLAPSVFNELSNEMKSLVAGTIEDFVILKFDVSTPNCLSIATNINNEDTLTNSYGYPNPLARAPHVQRGDLYQSSGMVFNSIESSGHYWQYYRQLRGNLSLYNEINYPPYLYLSDLDCHRGMSGGPVLNSAGELLGITIKTACNDQMYVSRSTYLISASEIKERVRQTFEREEYWQIWDCR